MTWLRDDAGPLAHPADDHRAVLDEKPGLAWERLSPTARAHAVRVRVENNFMIRHARPASSASLLARAPQPPGKPAGSCTSLQAFSLPPARKGSPPANGSGEVPEGRCLYARPGRSQDGTGTQGAGAGGAGARGTASAGSCRRSGSRQAARTAEPRHGSPPGAAAGGGTPPG